MRKGFKIGLIVISVIIAGFIGLGILGYRMITRSLPRTRGEIVQQALHGDVRVYRDGFHIPHIIAQNEHDLFFTQGYVTAQDRLWQMDLWKRAAEGRLSAIFGRTTLSMDSLMLTMGIYRTAKRIVPHLSPESQDVFGAYVKGVNAYIQDNRHRLPIEFHLLDYTPEPWVIEDCVAILRLFGWQTNPGWKTDITLTLLAEKVGFERIQTLTPDLKDEHFIHISMDNIQSLKDVEQFIGNSMNSGYSIGSNSWAVSGDRSVTGKPILANDPHLSLENPSILYENHLAGGDFNVYGFSIPGLPGVIIGHNENIAWGLTSLMTDDLDLFVESFNYKGATEYRSGNSYKPVEIIEETIPVRKETPVRMRILQTHHGPIVSNMISEDGLTAVSISLCWAGHEVSDEGLAYYLINKAENWTAFREALSLYGTSPQNFIYADRQGNIGIQAAGKIPIRSGKTGFSLRKGEDPENDWKGFIPFDELPYQKNPPCGFVASANHRITNLSGTYSISGYWAGSSRIDRIRYKLSEKDSFSVSDFKKMQADVNSIYAKNILELINPQLENLILKNPMEKKMHTLLNKWDGAMKTGSAEAAFFEVFSGKLLSNLFQDEMGDSLFTSFLKLHSLSLASVTQVLGKEESFWFDDKTTEGRIEGKKDIIEKSYRQTIDFLREEMGEDISHWTWGKLHTLHFQHPLGKHPLLSKILNLGPFHVGGSGTTIYCTGYDLNDPFSVLWGVSARIIIDLNNLNNTISVIPTGQSGQPLDKHYNDQLRLYLNNLYHPNLMDTAKVINSGWDCLYLRPE